MTSENNNQSGVTFKVSPVEVGGAMAKAQSLEDLFTSAKEHGVEGMGVNTTNPLYPAYMNPLIGTIHRAYSSHYPLVLSPDDVWTAIAQGFATHINENAEALRSRFVAHEGKVDLVVDLVGFVRGGPANPWGEGLTAFSDAIAENTSPKQRDLVVGNFTTTGPVERAASEIVLMGTMQKFFGYVGRTMCGIPEITLLGTPEDWKSIRDRVAAMGEYDLAWWTDVVTPILDQFVAASKGHVEKAFWESMYKTHDSSGGPYLNGWVNTLFAYHAQGYNGKEYVKTPVRNPFLDWQRSRSFGGPTTDSFPMGLTRVPWKWDYYGNMIDMEFLGGFVGVSQDPVTRAVRPALGWAVRDPSVAPKVTVPPTRGSLPDYEF